MTAPEAPAVLTAGMARECANLLDDVAVDYEDTKAALRALASGQTEVRVAGAATQEPVALVNWYHYPDRPSEVILDITSGVKLEQGQPLYAALTNAAPQDELLREAREVLRHRADHADDCTLLDNGHCNCGLSEIAAKLDAALTIAASKVQP